MWKIVHYIFITVLFSCSHKIKLKCLRRRIVGIKVIIFFFLRSRQRLIALMITYCISSLWLCQTFGWLDINSLKLCSLFRFRVLKFFSSRLWSDCDFRLITLNKQQQWRLKEKKICNNRHVNSNFIWPTCFSAKPFDDSYIHNF